MDLRPTGHACAVVVPCYCEKTKSSKVIFSGFLDTS